MSKGTQSIAREKAEEQKARGKYTRLPTSRERALLKRWATENMLKIKLIEW
jgi:hypothetical protein